MDEFSIQTSPSRRPAKCLLGVTILLVEDSRSSSEALRLMAHASGARVRRADSLNAAKRHLAAFRPQVAMVDLGLPDGSGTDLIKQIVEAEDSDIPVVAISGTDPDLAERDASAAGAVAFLEKPVMSLSQFQHVLLEHLPDRSTDGAQNPRFDTQPPELASSFIELDLENACDLLREGIQTGDRDELAYCASFMTGVAKQMDDMELMKLSLQLTARVASGHPGEQIGADLLSAIENYLSDGQAQTA